jgi:Nucleotide modification associated domain 2
MLRRPLGAERFMPSVYMYVVARDFGFAPNPFHGVCTLATCKPKIRKTAQVGDWVVGMGGAKLKAVGRCIYAMQVTDTRTFDAYWDDPMFHSKRPARNGSRKTIMGDNIYHRSVGAMAWVQEDSHHSQVDGSPEPSNIKNDTQTNRVLISHSFYYFGDKAPLIPHHILSHLGYRNQIGHRKFPLVGAQPLLDWIHANYRGRTNTVIGDPYQFMESGARYSKGMDKILD